MSTDFNIKPVGAPVAAPIVQPISEAAYHAVATELPASQSVVASDAGARASDSGAVHVSISTPSVSNQVVMIATRERSSIRWSTTGRAKW